ncbi:hypothetical protein [uncultured Rikenella sp.]|nr:hypothetical protein [uncultured Rikenella sp.]
MWSVGHYGYSWSTAPSGTKGIYLDFGMEWLRPDNSNCRANGFQLRCLSE